MEKRAEEKEIDFKIFEKIAEELKKDTEELGVKKEIADIERQVKKEIKIERKGKHKEKEPIKIKEISLPRIEHKPEPRKELKIQHKIKPKEEEGAFPALPELPKRLLSMHELSFNSRGRRNSGSLPSTPALDLKKELQRIVKPAKKGEYTIEIGELKKEEAGKIDKTLKKAIEFPKKIPELPKFSERTIEIPEKKSKKPVYFNYKNFSNIKNDLEDLKNIVSKNHAIFSTNLSGRKEFYEKEKEKLAERVEKINKNISKIKLYFPKNLEISNY